MTDAHMELTVHHAKPEVRSATEVIWINVPLDGKIFSQNTITLFLASPEVAIEMGRQLIAAGERQRRVADALRDPQMSESLRDA
jgi:hypothetical protein